MMLSSTSSPLLRPSFTCKSLSLSLYLVVLFGTWETIFLENRKLFSEGCIVLLWRFCFVSDYEFKTNRKRSIIKNKKQPLNVFKLLKTDTSLIQKKKQHCLCTNLKDEGEEKLKNRRKVLLFLVSTGLIPTLPCFGKAKTKSPYDEKRLLEQNRRVQRENNAPDDFPSFVREGFDVKVLASENYVKRESGLVYRDFEVGKGDSPKSGQQVIFHYVGYNESGRRIDSTYLQGTPAKIRMGTNGLVPGFEEGIRDMKPGGKRRIIIPPELGPPVGPSTFFSSKQFEVFDVELLSVQDCQRRTILAFYSDVVCN